MSEDDNCTSGIDAIIALCKMGVGNKHSSPNAPELFTPEQLREAVECATELRRATQGMEGTEQ
jgi:hypothetical protein